MPSLRETQRSFGERHADKNSKSDVSISFIVSVMHRKTYCRGLLCGSSAAASALWSMQRDDVRVDAFSNNSAGHQSVQSEQDECSAR